MSSLRSSVDCDHASSDETHWMGHLLEAVTVKSRSRGRMRFHLGFFADEGLADSLRRELQKIESVRLEAYSTRTRNALVTFDENHVDAIEVSTAVLRGVKAYGRLHGECDLEHEHHHHETPGRQEHAHDDDDCAHDHSALATDAGIRKELLKLVLTGGVLGYFVYKKLKGKPLAFYGNPLLDVASLVTIASGYSIFRAGVDSVQKHRKATDDTLISLAVVATLLMGESITGLSVVWLINLGRLLESVTLKRSRTAIKELMDIAPKEAWLVSQAGMPREKVARQAVEKIERGQVIRVFHAEKAPLDGRVVKGVALVKESFITGEAIPKEKRVGDSVYAGSVVESGDIDLEVTNLVHDTVVARMIDAIENVRDRKAPIEKIGTRFASQFVPISIGIAGVTLLLTGDLRRAITMLVIACPCAAGLATPTAVSASIGQAARKGILIKGGTHIETAARVDTLIFDKTGTLTEGTPTLQKFIAFGNQPWSESEENEALRIVASAEQHTTHPLGRALVEEACRRSLSLDQVHTHKTLPGMGIVSTLGALTVHAGNLPLMASAGIEVPEAFVKKAQQGFVAGESIVFFALDGALQGAFVVQDTVRAGAAELLDRLRSLGIKRVLLASGDQKIAVEHVARQLGLSEYHAELMPQGKLELVRSLKAQGCRVAMVGDGVNDAQALAEADLSIAMGAGRCDIAIEAADVTLARNDLLLVGEVLDISQKTLKTIYQNFVASVGINAGGLVFSAVGRLSPFSAAIVHNASTIVVVLNSLRLGREVAGTHPLQTLVEVKI